MILKVMMKSYNYIHLFATALLSAMAAVSCSDESPVAGTTHLQDVRFQVKVSDGVSVDTGTRADGEEANTIFDRFPTGVDFVNDQSRIRVCSVDRNPNSNFRLPHFDTPFQKGDEKANATRYHEYRCKNRHDYEEYSDFGVYKDAIALKWDEIDEETGEIKLGTGNILRTTVGGSYYMFAAMYPFTYERPGSGETLAVNPDQTYDPALGIKYNNFAAKLLLNDIRLCQKMFGYDHFGSPIRLDFFHSLCMLVVNVKVPLYHSSDGLGFEAEAIARHWPTMSIRNVGRTYSPQYELAYDQNDYVRVITDYTRLDSIRMFATPNFSNPDKKTGFTMEDMYYPAEEEIDGIKVPVAWMQYCVILPPQDLGNKNTHIFFSIAGKEYRCYFSAQTGVSLEQGHVTIVSLYIPRGNSDPILVGARLKDWAKKRTPIVPLQ